MADFIAVDPLALSSIRNVITLLKNAPPVIIDAAIDAVSEYALNVFRLYPPKTSVTRKAAYGQTFVSAKQRRFFFAALRDGRISVPYRRTQTFRNNWRQIGRGATSILANETPYSPFLMEPMNQARMMVMIGWKDTDRVIKEHEDQITRHAEAGADKAIKALGAA